MEWGDGVWSWKEDVDSPMLRWNWCVLIKDVRDEMREWLDFMRRRSASFFRTMSDSRAVFCDVVEVNVAVMVDGLSFRGSVANSYVGDVPGGTVLSACYNGIGWNNGSSMYMELEGNSELSVLMGGRGKGRAKSG